jgi:hypothetical protein
MAFEGAKKSYFPIVAETQKHWQIELITINRLHF